MRDFPWLIAVVTWPIVFALGFYLGRLSEKHKEFIVSRLDKVRAWFDRWVRVLYCIVALAALGGILLAGKAELQNRDDLVTSCQNANESRTAASSLWGYIIDVSVASNPDPTPEQRRFFHDLREYVDAVYVQHDCTDLSRKYPLPDPPQIPKPTP